MPEFVIPPDLAAGRLAAGISNVAPSLTLGTGQGAKFSSPTGGQVSQILIADNPLDPDAAVEAATFSGRTGDMLTGLVRGITPNGPAAGHLANALVVEVLGSGLLAQIAALVTILPSPTVVSETAFGQAAAVGASGKYSDGAHSHGTPVNPLPAHVAASDPHPGYALDTDLTAHAAAADPHAGYQKESEKGAASGYASLDGGTKVPVAQVPVMVASGASHAAGAVPDPGASAGTTKFLREDATFAVPPGTSSGGHTIQDEGTPLTARAALDFVGAGVTATDDAGGNRTVVTIPGSGGAPDHDHTAPGDGGVQTNDAHDGYSDYANIATPANPASGHMRAYSKSDSHFYKLDPSGNESRISGSGNAATVYNSAVASPPSAPATDDLWFPTDAPAGMLRSAGGVWLPYMVGLRPTAIPEALTGSWVEQNAAGSASWSTDLGGLLGKETGQGSGTTQWRFQERTISDTTAWKATIYAIINAITGGNQRLVLVARDSAGNAVVTFGVTIGSGRFVMELVNWSTYANGSATVVANGNFDHGAAPGQVFCFQMEVASGNRICRLNSWGGLGTFHQVSSVGRTSHVTANRIGFGMSGNGGAVDALLLGWETVNVA